MPRCWRNSRSSWRVEMRTARAISLVGRGRLARLAFVGGAAALDQELRRHLRRHAPPEPGLDDRQHQVERRHAAGAGDAVAVDAVEILDEVDGRKLLADRPQILPMDGAAIARQQ